MSKHQKHAKLSRPFAGAYARQEWAVLGAPCDHIQKLAAALIDKLGDRWKSAYVDADHHGEESAPASGAHFEYTDKIAFHRVDFKGKLSPFQTRPLFNELDLVLLNGNHFTAEKQILVIDPKKADSIQRKMDRLTDVRLILFADGVEALHPFLLEQMPHLASLPAFSITDAAAVARFLESELLRELPPLYGLVLAGGKSQRMGRDKGLIEYRNNLPQREYAFQLLQTACEETFLSVRPDQTDEIPASFRPLPDALLGLGPFGALLSAFQAHPDKAWLVLACDLPLVSPEALRFLIDHRNPAKIATAFKSPENDFPDPLFTIWEPKSYLVLLQFLAQGYSCPRKTLINSDIHLLQSPKPEWLRNVNTEEDYRSVIDLLTFNHLTNP